MSQPDIQLTITITTEAIEQVVRLVVFLGVCWVAVKALIILGERNK